jgi:hypothetical protein
MAKVLNLRVHNMRKASANAAEAFLKRASAKKTWRMLFF